MVLNKSPGHSITTNKVDCLYHDITKNPLDFFRRRSLKSRRKTSCRGMIDLLSGTQEFSQFEAILPRRSLSPRSQDQICWRKKILGTFSGILVSEFRFTVFIPWGCGVIPPLQFLVIQCLLQTFVRLFSKKKHESRSLQGWSVVKCQEFAGTIAEMDWINFMRLLGLLWHYLINFREQRILRKSSENQNFLPEQIWSCDRRQESMSFP